MNNYFEEENFNSIEDSVNNMSKSEIDAFKKMALDEVDTILSDESKRKEELQRLVESKASKKDIDNFNFCCLKYDLNVIVVQALTNMKKLLSNFDEDNYSSHNVNKNAKLFNLITTIDTIAITNIELKRKEQGGTNDGGESN